MRLLKAKRMRKEMKIINATLQILIYASLNSSKIKMWKRGYQSCGISWMTDIQANGRLLCPKIKLNGSLLRRKTLLEGMANDSEPRSNNLGLTLRTGPVLETGGQQRWDGCTAGKEKVVTHWKQCGSQDRPQCLSASPGGGFTAASAVELAEAAPSTAWGALDSCCHKHQRDLKTLFQTVCFSQ